MATTSPERRLHPSSILFELWRILPQMGVPLAVLLVGTRGTPFVALTAALMAGVAVAGAIVHYLRFTYRYEERDLVIRSGLFFRNERRIPYRRIQNLDAAQSVVHRALGVTSVYVQTGGGTEPEAKLRALPASALDEMRQRVLAAGGALVPAGASVATTAPVPDGAAVAIPGDPAVAGAAAVPGSAARGTTRRPLLHLQPGDLLLFGFIENRGLVLIAGALALVQQVGQGYTERLIDGGARRVIARFAGGIDIPLLQGAVYVVALVLVLLLVVRALSTVWALVRLYDFRLERDGDDLRTEYGLFTRVSATIPLRRVQTVIVREGVVHRMAGTCTVAVETAGGTGGEPGAPQREPIAPLLATTRLRDLLHEIQPDLDPSAILWQRTHPRAFGRIMRAELLWPVLLSGVAFVLVREWAAGLALLLLVLAVVKARLRARQLGWALCDDFFAVRDGALTTAIRIARFNRLQVAALRRNPFDLRAGMATVRADTAGARGGGTAVPYLAHDTAARLHAELVARSAATGFTW